MKTILAACILSTLLCSCHKQEGFIIQVLDTSAAKATANLKLTNSSLYEDAEVIASASCAGEFGGGIRLYDKQNGKTYGCFATCPLALYKINNKFTAVATVAHGTGFSSIIEIDNLHKLNSYRTELRQGQRLIGLAFNDKVFKQGTVVLADTMGLLILSSFVHDGRLYHIMSNFNQTFLATNNRTKFILIKPIANFSTFDTSYKMVPNIVKSTNGHYITFYKNSSTQGFVEVYGDTIKLVRYQAHNN